MRPAGVWPLIALRLAVARGRFQRAIGQHGHRAGPMLEVVVTAGSVLLLLLSAAAFALVGTVLAATLAERGEPALAASAAGGAALVGLLLAVLAVVLSDAQGTGLDERPLLPLPVRTADRLGAELTGLLAFEPAAAVIWPTSAVVLLAAAQAGPRAAMLAVPAASGQALLAAALALLARRLNDRPGGARRLPWLILGTLAVLLATTTLSPTAAGAAWLPWHWVSRAFSAARAGDPAALAWGLLLHLAGFGVLALARTAPVALERAARALRSRLHRRTLPSRPSAGGAEWRRVWGPSRARAVLTQTLAAGGGVLLLGGALEIRSASAPPLMPWAAAVACWILAAGPAPLLANALGLGGTAGAGALHAARRPLGRLAADHLRLTLPGLAGTVVAAFVAAASAPQPALAARIALAVGLGMAAGLSGAGAALSTLCPWAASLDGPRAPLWTPSGARSVMALVQGGVLAPLATGLWLGPEGIAAGAFATLGVGLAAGASGWAVASWRLRRGRGRILEALLS
jgi:hypothetical protein